MSQLQKRRVEVAKGYSWLFFHPGRSWNMGLLVTLIVIITGGSFYIWYNQFGSDIAPNSIAGYGYAISGTLCFVLAALLYTLQRRSRTRVMGQLNGALNWHVFLAIMGIALLIMHAFGNFHAKTGTYALYGLIVLVISGFVGRMLDRMMPWLIAAEVSKMLTWQGDEQLISLRHMRRSLRREQFYRAIIHHWRRVHILFALLTIGLIIWHLVYVAQLLLAPFFHHGARPP